MPFCINKRLCQFSVNFFQMEAANKILEIDSLKVKKFSEVQVMDVFKNYHEASTLILAKNLNVDEIYEKLTKMIEEKLISIQFVIKTILHASDVNYKEKQNLADLASKLKEKFEFKLRERDEENLQKLIAPEQVDTECPFYLVKNDLVDKLKEKIVDFAKLMTDDKTLLDFACKYGSLQCYEFLIEKGCTITDNTIKYAIQGQNMKIIEKMDKEKIGNYLSAAISVNNNELADWILANYKAKAATVSQCLDSSNFVAASFFIENGFDIKEMYEILCYHITLLRFIII